jgi:hypothetical protein
MRDIIIKDISAHEKIINRERINKFAPEKKLLIILILFALNIASCNNGTKKNVDKIDPKLNTESNTTNDRFRKVIISKITNPQDLKQFNTLLTALDKKGVSFCQFVQRLLELDDSCYAAAKRRVPDPSNQKEFVKLHDNAIKMAEKKYLEYLKVENGLNTFAVAAYSFDNDIKQFCDRTPYKSCR